MINSYEKNRRGAKEERVGEGRGQGTEARAIPDNHDALVQLLGSLPEVMCAMELVEHALARVPLDGVVLLLRFTLRHGKPHRKDKGLNSVIWSTSGDLSSHSSSRSRGIQNRVLRKVIE